MPTLRLQVSQNRFNLIAFGSISLCNRRNRSQQRLKFLDNISHIRSITLLITLLYLLALQIAQSFHHRLLLF